MKKVEGTETTKKTEENLKDIIITLLGNAKQDSVLIMFCKELEASDDKQELAWFCDNRCEFHKTPFELYCFPYSAKYCLREKQKGEKQT